MTRGLLQGRGGWPGTGHQGLHPGCAPDWLCDPGKSLSFCGPLLGHRWELGVEVVWAVSAQDQRGPCTPLPSPPHRSGGPETQACQLHHDSGGWPLT